MTECLDFFIGSWQCKHIILGACHDGGYAQFLGEFAADPSKRERITLLHGTKIHTSIAALGFTKRLKLDTVFAPHKAASHQNSPSPPPIMSGTVSKSAAKTTSGATIPPNPGAREFINPVSLSERLGPVIRNEAGKRLDKKLNVDINSGYLKVLRENKFCYYYHLRGKCKGGCGKNHIFQCLNPKEFDDLWYIARTGVCNQVSKGKDCDDQMCVYRHEEACQLGSGIVWQ